MSTELPCQEPCGLHDVAEILFEAHVSRVHGKETSVGQPSLARASSRVSGARVMCVQFRRSAIRSWSTPYAVTAGMKLSLTTATVDAARRATPSRRAVVASAGHRLRCHFEWWPGPSDPEQRWSVDSRPGGTHWRRRARHRELGCSPAPDRAAGEVPWRPRAPRRWLRTRHGAERSSREGPYGEDAGCRLRYVARGWQVCGDTDPECATPGSAEGP